MTLPTAKDLFPVIDATWPAAQTVTLGPITLRQGQGGGSRVSAATVNGPFTSADIEKAEKAMESWSQPRLFMVRDCEDALDQFLQSKGYHVMDPVWIYAADVDLLATERPAPASSFEVWPPLAAQREVWAAGGIGPSRIAIMERATGPKTSLMGRIDDKPIATTYVAQSGNYAMLHALEVDENFRQRGMGRTLTVSSAFWARDNGASHLTLLTTQANEGANRLYSSLGMTIVGQYHYRIQA